MTTASLPRSSKTFVLVDPTSPDGESTLALLEPSDLHTSVVVLLSGRSSGALREYAECENIDIALAASIYLDQVAERISAEGRIVETISTHGPDPARDLAELVAVNKTRRVLVPASLQRIDPAGFRLLVQDVPCTVAGKAFAAHAA